MKLGRKTLLRGIALAIGLGCAGALAVDARAETVRVTVAYYSDKTGPYFEKMASEFHKANPGIDVKIEVVNWDSLLQKLQTDISGGTNADISIIGTRWLLDFVKDDQAEPLDGYMSAEFKDRFIGPFLAPGQIDGKTYGLPIAASARAMYYNKDLLAKAGLTAPPATWDDAGCRRGEAEGRRHRRLRPCRARRSRPTSIGTTRCGPYGGDVVGTGQQGGLRLAPAGVKALTMYKSMIDKGLTEDGVDQLHA